MNKSEFISTDSHKITKMHTPQKMSNQPSLTILVPVKKMFFIMFWDWYTKQKQNVLFSLFL